MWIILLTVPRCHFTPLFHFFFFELLSPLQRCRGGANRRFCGEAENFKACLTRTLGRPPQWKQERLTLRTSLESTVCSWTINIQRPSRAAVWKTFELNMCHRCNTAWVMRWVILQCDRLRPPSYSPHRNQSTFSNHFLWRSTPPETLFSPCLSIFIRKAFLVESFRRSPFVSSISGSLKCGRLPVFNLGGLPGYVTSLHSERLSALSSPQIFLVTEGFFCLSSWGADKS